MEAIVKLKETNEQFQKRIKLLITADHLRVIADYIDTENENIGSASAFRDEVSGDWVSYRFLKQILMG